MRTVAHHGHAHRVDGGVRAHRVALDARNLHQPTHRIAGQSQIVLDADLCGVLHLLRGAAQHRGQSRGGHRTGHAHLAPAADLGAGDRGVALEQVAHGPRGQQETDHTLLVGHVHEMPVIQQHGGDDAGRTVGRRGDDAASARVLLAHRQREQVDPRGVRGFQHDVDASRVTFEDVAIGGQPRVHPRCAPRHIQPPGNTGSVLEQPLATHSRITRHTVSRRSRTSSAGRTAVSFAHTTSAMDMPCRRQMAISSSQVVNGYGTPVSAGDSPYRTRRLRHRIRHRMAP